MSQSSSAAALAVRTGASGILAVPPLPPQFAGLQQWANSLQQTLGRNFNALKLDQSGTASALHQLLPGFRFTFTGAQYLTQGHFDFNHATGQTDIILSLFRNIDANGNLDPLRPDVAHTLQRPRSLGNDWLRVVLTVPPQPKEAFNASLLILPDAFTG